MTTSLRPERKRPRHMRAPHPAPRFWAATALAVGLTTSAIAGSAVAWAADSDSSDIVVSVPSPTPTTVRPWSPSPAPSVPVAAPPASAPGNVPPAAVPPTKASTSTVTTPGTGAASGAGQPAGPATEPAISATPATTGEKAATDRENYTLGDQVTVSLDGFRPGEKVQILLYSQSRTIGNVPADEAGRLSHTFTLPDDLPVGAHTLQLTGWESQRIGLAPIFVTAAPSSDLAAQGVPVWMWWVGGGLGALLLVAGAWWALRALRAPAPVEGAVA
ncbi:hypothetical protein [Microbacterium sp. Bi128]|uniref:hypothetical protein n=1 Tax=Microbacterium sp. Bi128 TaxID=2821115 RepID=UPI001E0BB119|nr:hypothetical protein [Microbacterium sp. Bi128]CAH0244196.1 hypothetical protein SRABI128_02753 [Microbacterium sp. Bi128]